MRGPRIPTALLRRQGSTRAASRSIVGALVAPPGRQARHGPERIRRQPGPRVYMWHTPPEARPRVVIWAEHGISRGPWP